MISGLNLEQLREFGLGATAVPSTPSYSVNTASLPAGSSAAYAGADWNTFMRDYGPLIERQMGSLNSTELVDRAKADAAVVPSLVTGATRRAAQRRGGMTLTQRTALGRAGEVSEAATSADLINNARLDQRQRNTETAYKLSGLGTDIYQMGLDNVRESEGLAAQRRANNAAASQQAKSNALGLATTAAAMFLL